MIDESYSQVVAYCAFKVTHSFTQQLINVRYQKITKAKMFFLLSPSLKPIEYSFRLKEHKEDEESQRAPQEECNAVGIHLPWFGSSGCSGPNRPRPQRELSENKQDK